MASSSSSTRPLPYDLVRPSYVDEASATHPNMAINVSIVAPPSNVNLSVVLNQEVLVEWQAVMAQMAMHRRIVLNPTFSQAETDILLQNSPIYDHDHGNNADPIHDQENVHPGYVGHYNYGNSQVYGPGCDQQVVDPTYADSIHRGNVQQYYPILHSPLFDVENVNPNSTSNHHRGGTEEYHPIFHRPIFDEDNTDSHNAGNQHHDNAQEYYPVFDPIYDQENIDPSFAGNDNYGRIIIPSEIAPLQESLLNSGPTAAPALPREDTPYPLGPLIDVDSFHDQRLPLIDMTPTEFLIENRYYNVTDNNHCDEGTKRKRVWNEDDEESFNAMRPGKVARWDSLDVNVDPDEDLDDRYQYEDFRGHPQGPMVQEQPDIRESIEYDDDDELFPEEITLPLKLEEAEDPFSSSNLTMHASRSTKSHRSANLSLRRSSTNDDNVISRYF